MKKVGNKEEKKVENTPGTVWQEPEISRRDKEDAAREGREDTEWINPQREDDETQVQHIGAEQVIINLTGSGNETRQEESDQNYNREHSGNMENNSSRDR